MNNVQTISFDIARPFIERYHYSRCVPKGRNIFFGWFIDDELYAVSDYGNGVNAYQASYLSRITGHEITNDNMVELKRLVRSEPKRDKYPLTRFLSLCGKELRKLGIKYIVSFSDPTYNHSGGIYKAANFKHLGRTNAEWHVVDSEGTVHHRKYPYRYAQRHGCSIEEAREILGLTRVKTLQKDRWFYEL